MIAAVVLTYDAPDGMLADCLAALARTARGTGPDDPVVVVIVVDNGTRAHLAGDVLRGVTLIESPANLGYAGGVNLGIRHALGLGAEAVFVLNADMPIEPGWLAPLLAALADTAVSSIRSLASPQV